MPVQLTRPGDPTEPETVDVEIDGTTFTVRRYGGPSWLAMQKIVQRRLAAGESMVSTPVVRELLAWMIAGWEGLENASGDPVPFDPEFLYEVVNALPKPVAMRLRKASGVPMADAEQEGPSHV